MKHAGIEISTRSPLLVGVINLSPESFFKGSVASSSSTIEDKIIEFSNYGVDCLDVGAMSTRPLDIYGGVQATITEEKKRVNDLLPELMEIAKSYDIPVALDTQFAEVAKRGIDLGVKVINDISGFKTDPEMVSIISEHDVDVVVMATNTKPGDVCGIDATLSALQSSLDIASKANVERKRISIDPGFGGWQGRGSDCDLELIQQFDRFKVFELPIYIGISRKSTIGTLGGGAKPEDRLSGTIVLTQYLLERGANIIRTHDVKATRLALNVKSHLDRL